MPDVRRPTLKANGTTDVSDNFPRPGRPRASAAKQVMGNTDAAGGLAGYYTFPSPQRTARPGLPQQTTFPKAP